MGAITPDNLIEFKPSDELFARVRKSLASFDAAGLIDEGDFYHYVKEVLESVGVSYYQENQAILEVTNYQAPLPANFYQLYAAWLCEQPKSTAPAHGVEANSTKWVIEKETLKHTDCEIECSETERELSVTVRTYYNNVPSVSSFRNPVLLSLSPHVKPKFTANGCRNTFATGSREITIERGVVHTNFTGGAIYLQYYGLPADERTGLPLIPEDTTIEKAIEYYIMWRELEKIYLNDYTESVERRMMYVKQQFEENMGNARYKAKLPSFNTMLNAARRQRNRFDIYNQLIPTSRTAWYCR